MAKRLSSIRCIGCGLTKTCICDAAPKLATQVHFWILIHPEERFKPTGTARLIKNCLTTSRVITWSRKVPPELAELLARDHVVPCIASPLGGSFVEFYGNALADVVSKNEPHKEVAIIILDGTWRQARKMYIKSEYLHGLPLVSVTSKTPSRYTLRKQSGEYHLSTVETAITFLNLGGEVDAASALDRYFEDYLSGYRNNSLAE
ncbi:DTW domain-containing protein [Oligoflexia bacterium]|nr:DTW domain-containing protein [Oligoflexia bacterium]